jgi:hypothetical protein
MRRNQYWVASECFRTTHPPVAAAAAAVVAVAAAVVAAAAVGYLEECAAQKKRSQGYPNSNPGADASMLRGARVII